MAGGSIEDAGAGFWVAYGSITYPGAGHAPGGMSAYRVDEDHGQLVAVRDVPRVRADDGGSAAPGDVWRPLLERYTDWSIDVMLRIIDCESHFDENAVSPDGTSVGPFQIHVIHGYSYEEMTDPSTATDIAHDVWLSQSYAAWSCWDGGY